MRSFLGFIVSCSIALSVASCGSRDDVSQLTGRKKHNNPKKHNDSGDVISNGGKEDRVEGRFPHKPHPETTPGSLCQKSNTFRYPEHIKYCERNVDKEQKREIFINYDSTHGYQTTEMERMDFKIDQLVPLCMGGSNNSDNLWPQHKTIYEHTDPLEPFLCETMAAGKIKQAEAVKILLEIKQDPFTAGEELRKLEGRF